jgi:hypothetical protein
MSVESAHIVHWIAIVQASFKLTQGITPYQVLNRSIDMGNPRNELDI